ncbi:alpha/beta hydrolase [Streptomyces sp. DSM 44915]|uniref:Alpha/beta hydrolase n=1 Tax=Streptomyces chisholmiae TaxID=3075540 RepID=A0ABU2JXV3_9ACTN|nr:alpha/beta hydrolase [Streptomyces sp. DSM 44915]MDT0269832.1 alpha/beta hydrolase [Streptomyces sp. DSM 44915]
MTARLLTQRALAELADLPATSRWARSGSVRLHVLDYGGPGRPVLILPGITTPAVGLDFVARRLTDLCRPLVLDVRGRGLSDYGPTGPDTLADDVLAVVAGLRLDRPVLLGHSMGARVAATAAARPDSPISGTVLVDPPLSGPGRGPYPTPLAVFLDQLGQARRGTTAAEVARSWPGWPERELRLRAGWLASCSEAAVRATHAGFESEDFFDVWPAVPAPTVFVHGADSPVVTAAGAAEVARAHPGAAVVPVPGAGHMVFWDAPEAALATVRTALARVLA